MDCWKKQIEQLRKNSSLQAESPQDMTLDKESDGGTAEIPLKQSRSLKRKLADADDKSKEERAYVFLDIAAKELTTNRDINYVFGQLVAAQLNQLSPRNQAIARNRIHNTLFKLEMQEMDASSNNVSQFPVEAVIDVDVDYLEM